MKFRPNNYRLIVKRLEEDTKKSLIEIPDSAKEKMQLGVIIATGDKTGMSIRKDAVVLFGKYSGIEVELEGQNLLILHEDEILAIKEE